MADSTKKYITYTDAATYVSNSYNHPLSIYYGSGYSYYYPLTGKNINVINVDGTSAVKSFVAQGSNPTYLNITFKNYIVNKKTTGNAWYPMAIAGKQYANMTNGECLPTYYCSGVTINPYQGKIKVNDLILVTTGGTEISVASLLTPQTVDIALDTITVHVEAMGNYVSVSNLSIRIFSDFDSATYNFGSGAASSMWDMTCYAPKPSLTIDASTFCNVQISGTINGHSVSYYHTFVQNMIDGDYGMPEYDTETIGPMDWGLFLPYANDVYIDFQSTT